MTFLLVDDRDGRIVAELQTPDAVERVLTAWTREDGGVPDYLCLVELRSDPGAFCKGIARSGFSRFRRTQRSRACNSRDEDSLGVRQLRRLAGP